jgi:hypothetical protein
VTGTINNARDQVGTASSKAGTAATGKAAGAAGKATNAGLKTADVTQKAARTFGGDAKAATSLALDAVNTKIGRTSIRIWVAGSAVFLLLSAYFVSMVLGAAVQSGTSIVESMLESKSVEAALTDGLDQRSYSSARDVADAADVPWQIPAAILHTAPDSDGEGVTGYDPDEIDNFAGSDDLTWFTEVIAAGLNGVPTDVAALDNGADEQSQSRFIPAGSVAAEGTRDLWLNILGSLPLAGQPDRAEEVFDLARTWALGNQHDPCATPGQFAAYTGVWVNPTEGRISSRFGPRLHPVLGIMRLHDGTDIAAPGGTPVYAASGGTVEVKSTV